MVTAANIDCEGKAFLCPTVNSYLQCTDQPDGSSRTTTTEIRYCPPGTYCDHNYGEFECDSPLIPESATSTQGIEHFLFEFSSLLVT